MNLSYFTLRRLTDDLQRLVGDRVERAALSPPNSLTLSFGRGGRRSHLYFSASRTQGRACLIPNLPAASADRPVWLDRNLEGAVLRTLEQTPYERLLTFSFERRDRLGDTFRTHLIAELIGRNANLIVVNPDTGRIVHALRHVKGESRRILPGRIYEPPAPQDRVPPDDLAVDTLVAAFDQHKTAVGALCGVLPGMDPLTAAEVLHRSTSPSPMDVLRTLQSFYTSPPFAPEAYILLNARGGKPVTPFHLTHLDQGDLLPHPDISAAIEAAIEGEQKQATAKGRFKDLRRLLGRRIKSLRSRCEKIERDIEAAENADQLERIGSLILAQLDAVPSNVSTVTLRDLYTDGEPPIEIQLDSKRSPLENGSRYLRRAKKLTKSKPILLRRLAKSRVELAELERRSDELAGVEDEARLETLHEALVADGLVRPPKRRPKPASGRGAGDIHPRRYLTSDGWEVWVGRNDAENDRLSRVVPKTDIWMHAQGCSGSHVVLRRKTPNADPTPTALVEAAALAAYWSKARGARTVPVNYTEARHVQKPRGAPPGLVTIRNEKTIFVEPREIRKVDET